MTARRPADDTGSLALALLLTLVGVSLTALLVPMVVRQIDTTRASAQRIQALSAAQAGIDVALGHIRAANNGSGAGVLAKLPCSPLTGRVSGAGNATYVVTFAYYAADPIGGGPTIDCSVGGYGVRTAPSYALIRATGTDQPAGGAPVTRTLQASYVFSTTNQNIPGGLIHVYKTATSTDLCLDAGSGAPTLGTSVRMQPCSPGSSRQKFAYNTNLTLTLVASKTATQPLGMCLDAGSPHAAGSLVQFQPCSATTKPQQQWSLNDQANFEGTTDGVNLDHLCFNVQSQNTAGSLVVLGAGAAGKCYNGSYDNIQTFSVEASVGAGAAGASAGQLVNFNQFGRCIDVTELNPAKEFMIVWPCKQAPNPANVRWNQKFALPAFGVAGRITTNPGSLYCLQSPGSVAPASYVRTVNCPGSGMPRNLTWTVYGDTGSYLTGYRIVDGYGYCLSPSDPAVDRYAYGVNVSKLVVAPCSASTLQKWNAPPNILQALPLKDIGEK